MVAPLRIALAGLGTVGAGVIRLVEANADLIARRAGRPIVVTVVGARDRNKDRGVDLTPYAWEDDMVIMGEREDVDVVVELVGGSDGPALSCARTTIEAGKALVTANKAMSRSRCWPWWRLSSSGSRAPATPGCHNPRHEQLQSQGRGDHRGRLRHR